MSHMNNGAATAEACANIALVKYWGKRDHTLNLPARGSLSVTVDALRTRTTVRFDAGHDGDELVVDDVPRKGVAGDRATRVLDLVRERSGVRDGARVVSKNNFPYGSGLASSASGMAALALAASRAAGLQLSTDEVSALARRGSGSAARSLHGGFVEWRAGTREDGEDSHGVQLRPPESWDIRVLVALVGAGEKTISSTRGMAHTCKSSAYHESWLAGVDDDLAIARKALAARDLETLGTVAEGSCLRMHASMIAAEPGLLYWRGPTVELIHRVRLLRRRLDRIAWFTIDAGPHVKVLTLAENAAEVATAIGSIPGVDRVITSRVGGAARVLDSEVQ